MTTSIYGVSTGHVFEAGIEFIKKQVIIKWKSLLRGKKGTAESMDIAGGWRYKRRMCRNRHGAKTPGRKKRRKKRYLLKFIVIIAVIAGLYAGLHIDRFDINGIAVGGNKEISDEEILKLSGISNGDNIFDTHPWFVERKIKKNLYIETVDVRRKLPDKIEIIVKERSGKAQFVMGDKYVITDNTGMVLEVSSDVRNVTTVSGVTVTGVELEKTVKVKEISEYSKAMSLIKAAEEGDLYFKSIDMNSSQVTAKVYKKLRCQGQYSNFMNVIENQTLKAVIFDLYQKGKDCGVISIGSNDYCSFSPKK